MGKGGVGVAMCLFNSEPNYSEKSLLGATPCVTPFGVGVAGRTFKFARKFDSFLRITTPTTPFIYLLLYIIPYIGGRGGRGLWGPVGSRQSFGVLGVAGVANSLLIKRTRPAAPALVAL